jgi:signal transduction histidine kinase
LRIRGKLALLVIIPLLAMVALTVPVVLERIDRAGRAADTADAVRLAGRVGALVQDVQLERMLTIGMMMRTVEPARVQRQVAEVNDHAARLAAEDGLPRAVKAAVDGVAKLAPLREGVRDGITAPDKLIVGYGATVTALLNSLGLERGVDVSTSEGRQVVALDASMRTDELITVGAAYLVLAVATKRQEALLPYYTNFAVLSDTVNRFSAFATPQQVELYTQVQEKIQRGFGVQDFVPAVNVNPLQALAKVPLATIYPALEAVVGPGRVVSDRIITDVTDLVDEQERQALVTAYVVAGVSLLVLLLVVVLSIAVARAVVRPLTRLTRSADRVARVTEAELTRVADDDAEVAGEIRLDPVDVGARDEVGDLARAFDRVQGTAVGLVERQVASRRNVAQMFGHVGRRTQNLVGRQIALIDRLEDQEADPERLQHLYRLDHISSRLRRNAGSLVALSGAANANEHDNPLALGDVVRLALAEIEDYTRVDVAVPAELALTPAAINDIVLVLAELMENATVFSPPHTRVEVSAASTPYGARIAVVDHGIGMPDRQLEQENARMQRRERLDLAPTGVLGLFVVGRLARRHGLRVLLGGTPGGGVTATVDLPDVLLAAAWAAPAPAAPARPAVEPRRERRALPTAAGIPAAQVEYRTAPEPSFEVFLPNGERTTFNVAAVHRASESISAGSTWSAFVPRPRDDRLDLPVAGRPAAGLTALEMGDYPTAVLPAVALVEPYEEVPQPGPVPLTRRRPGATLEGRPEPSHTSAMAAQPPDPDEARALVEQFEAGVVRALGEVRFSHRPEEGS